MNWLESIGSDATILLPWAEISRLVIAHRDRDPGHACSLDRVAERRDPRVQHVLREAEEGCC